jgi:ubiquinone/menaquinone biosynthesis C-methylase UbiE
MTNFDWWCDDARQVGLDFADAAQVASYDARQGGSAERDAALLRRLGLAAGMSLADIGCGTGILVCEAAGLGAQALGIDVSAAMLEAARARAARLGRSRARFLRAGFLSFEVPEASFDLITTKNALHHLPDFWKAMAMTRLYAALKPGGRLYIRDVIFNEPPHRLAAAAEAWVGWMAANTGYARAEAAGHVRDEHSTFGWVIERLLTDTGFRLIERTHDGVYGEFLAERPD